MNGMLNMFAGVRVLESPNCLATSSEPKRIHKKKNWMSDHYHARVQKKWIKRFGYVMVPAAYQTPLGIVCHPVIAERIRHELARQGYGR